MTNINVPFFRPEIGEPEILEVVETLRSGWLTSGKRVQLFERNFADAIHCAHAVAVNSCTAALHLAIEALGLRAGQAVLVPTMTFAATAEVVRYFGATPILVDCDPITLNMDLDDAARKLSAVGAETDQTKQLEVVGLIPVHVGGLMMDIGEISSFANAHDLWTVEDAAHAFPAAWRPALNHDAAQSKDMREAQAPLADSQSSGEGSPWRRCGEETATVTCFSFYANKTITTGEGGMAVTADEDLAQRMRLMSLHGLSQDSWLRYSTAGSWDYKIIAPGFKYNLTDIAAALGIHQLQRAEQMRQKRAGLAQLYMKSFADLDEIELPPDDIDRIHSWHLFPIKLRLDRLSIDRDTFMSELKQAGVGCSVHWRPLHLHPYYEKSLGWKPEDFPVATAVWKRLVSLPIFSAIEDGEAEYVIEVVRGLCLRYAR